MPLKKVDLENRSFREVLGGKGILRKFWTKMGVFALLGTKTGSFLEL